MTGDSANSGVTHNSQRSMARGRRRGQVAQVVERSPEKAGVGGSTPSLATMFSITSEHVTPQLCPKLVQKFNEWLPEFASTLTGNRKTSCRVLQDPQLTGTKKGCL
jgi:hypothetical protein